MPKSEASQEEILSQYATAPQQLETLLAGLSEADLNLARAPGKWTIRAIVHHIVDTDDMVKSIILAALSHSGCVYDQSWYDTSNTAAETLCYATRAIAPALALFRANHEYVEATIRHIPDAGERFVLLEMAGVAENRKIAVDYLIQSRVHHAEHHFAQIRETRKKHGV